MSFYWKVAARSALASITVHTYAANSINRSIHEPNKLPFLVGRWYLVVKIFLRVLLSSPSLFLSFFFLFCFLTLFVLSVVGVISSFFFSVAPLCCTCQLRLNYSKPAIHCRSIVGCKRHARISLQARLSLTFYWPTEKRCRSFMFSRSSFAFLRRPRVSGVIRTESFFSPPPPLRIVVYIALLSSSRAFTKQIKKKREGKPSSLRNAPTSDIYFSSSISLAVQKITTIRPISLGAIIKKNQQY